MVKGSWLMVDSSIITYAELLTQEIDVKIYAKKLSIGEGFVRFSLNFLTQFPPRFLSEGYKQISEYGKSKLF